MKIEIIQTIWRNEQFHWSAIDVNSYDGAEDSPNRDAIGYGRTPAEALDDLLEKLEECK
jgi:hypothetical protein